MSRDNTCAFGGKTLSEEPGVVPNNDWIIRAGVVLKMRADRLRHLAHTGKGKLVRDYSAPPGGSEAN
jgi:hypothetical protein